MFRRIITLTLVLIIILSFTHLPAAAMPPGDGPISQAALDQIAALLAEKEARTASEQKVDSNLLLEAQRASGRPLSPASASLQTGIHSDAKGLTVVDITADVSPELLKRLEAQGAQVISSYPEYRTVRASVPLTQVLDIAGWSEVIFIQPQQQGRTPEGPAAGQPAPNWLPGRAPASTLDLVSPGLRATLPPGFEQRAERVQAQMSAALAGLPASAAPAAPQSVSATAGLTQTAALNRSEGDIAHRADLARNTYGYTGAGVKVCVLSDGVDSLAALQASGDLPAVTVLPGQAGSGNEGAAMLEIIYDLAPQAQLFYASAFNGIASFAANIKALRSTYGCDMIVDDVSYFAESPFQLGQAPAVVSTSNGGIVTQAVNDVTAAGALYFSSAGNSGSLAKGTSGVWEGDFANGGAVGAPLPGSGTLLDFNPGAGVQAYASITSGGGPLSLYWADPLGGAANDYDLFLVSSTGTSVYGSSTNLQNGTQDPFEIIGLNLFTGDRVVVVQKTGAANRYLQVNTNRGRLQFGTTGQIFGHAAALQAFAVAAAYAGQPAVVFGPTTVVEDFSSDGLRRYFFNPDSSAVTPGNFSASGGAVIQKPELTAADGVSCAAPGFNPFYGTSAAAPHAAAIAALLRSAKPTLTNSQMRSLLTSAPAAIDIEAPGVDNVSGAGALNALAAMQAVNPAAVALLTSSGMIVQEGTRSNGNGVTEPGESLHLTVPLSNTTLVAANNVRLSLQLVNPPAGAFLGPQTPLSFGNIPSKGAASNHGNPFILSTSSTVACGATLNFKNTVTYDTSPNSPQIFYTNYILGLPTVISTTLDTAAPPSSAITPVYTGSTGLQTGRLTRSGVVSSCSAPKTNPGLNTASGSRRYDAYTFTNTNAYPTCVTVQLTTPQNGGTSFLFAVVYNQSGFNPAAPSNNYLADPGFSGSPTTPVTFSFTAQAGQGFTIVVHEVTPGAGVGPGLGAYQLNVSGEWFLHCDAPPQQAASIASSLGGNDSALIGQPFANPLQASVRAADLSPVPEVPVIFTDPTSGASANFNGGNLAFTDLSGNATVFPVANFATGTYTVTANTAGPALASPALFPLMTNLPGNLRFLPTVVRR